MPDQNNNRRKWQKTFLFCFGIALATAFCMKWMEKDLLYNGQLFSVIGLELSYPAEKVQAILSGIDPSVHRILTYHLSFDFLFMVGVFPGVAALCMLARGKSTHRLIRKILLILALSQLLAWGCDITENCWLLTWLSTGKVEQLQAFHFLVFTKWVIVCLGIITGIIFSIKKNKTAETQRR